MQTINHTHQKNDTMKPIAEIIPFGDQEPELSKLTKQLYVTVQHKDPITKIDFKDFITNIKEHCKMCDFDWTCRDPKTNRRVYPSYDKKNAAKNWPVRYDYRGAYKEYANYVNNEDGDELLLLNDTLRDSGVRGLFIILQQIEKDLKELQEKPKTDDYSFELKRLLESYKLCLSIIAERLGLDVKKLEVNGNIKSESKIELGKKSKQEMDDEYEAIFKGYFTQDTNGDAPDS